MDPLNFKKYIRFGNQMDLIFKKDIRYLCMFVPFCHQMNMGFYTYVEIVEAVHA